MPILDIIFPRTCFGCGKEGSYLCEECVAEVGVPKPIYKSYPLGGLITIWKYEGAIRKAIIALKYKFASDIAEELAEEASAVIRKRKLYLPKDPVLVSIPLHTLRANWRGFNQSEEIGKSLASKMGWKFIPDLLTKTKSTASQAELKKEKRLFNLMGAFSLNPRYRKIRISFPIVLFDDVFTTGSTLKEAARALKSCGANKVWGLTLVR